MTEREIAAEEQVVHSVVKGLPERQRRTVERRLERGEKPLDVVEEYVDVQDSEQTPSDSTFETGNRKSAENGTQV